MEKTPLRILLIEDDEDDYVVFRDLLNGSSRAQYELDWTRTFQDALKEIICCRHDIYFLDYRLGEHDGLELLREVARIGCNTPVIVLTGLDDYRIDDAAMKLGAVDYLVKQQITAPLIERSIRYALERKRVEKELRASITERLEAERALQEKMTFLQLLMDTIPNPIFYKDQDGRFHSCNKAFLDYLGMKPEDVLGKTVFDVFPDDVAHRFSEMDMELIRNPGIQVYEGALKRPDGSRRDIICNSASFFRADGSLAGLIGVIVDISQRKRMEEALRESEKQLRDLSLKLIEVQEEERTRLAHKLHDDTGQTLVAIQLGMETVLRAKDGGDAMRLVQRLEPLIPIVQEATREVRRLYMDLRPTVLDDFGVAAALGWLIREFEDLCPDVCFEKQIQIEKVVPEPLGIVIYRLAQEALSNVAEHSHAHKAFLSLKNVEGGGIELTVEDDGEGFDVEEVFSSDYCKRGLGLASMKERVKFSGGCFFIESDEGKGTRIRARWQDAA